MRSPIAASVSALAALVVLGGAAMAAWWATAQVADPPADPVAKVEPVTYTVESGQVGRTLDFNGFAAWTTEVEVAGFPSGVVTELMVADGEAVDVGDVVMSVDLAPSVVVAGTVPSFRTLESGVEGADVAQLQRFLVVGGWYTGAVDGRYGNATRQAVKQWQAASGMLDDGVVDLGEVVFLDGLPARVRLLVAVGERIPDVDTPALALLAPAPAFWIPIAVQQQQLIPPEAQLELRLPGGQSIPAVVTSAVETDNGVDLHLGGIDAVLCGSGCPELSVADRTPIDITAEVTPATSGPIVPLSAIDIGAAGVASVLLASGEVQIVEVLAEDRGLAVVDGVAAGTSILLHPPDEG